MCYQIRTVIKLKELCSTSEEDPSQQDSWSLIISRTLRRRRHPAEGGLQSS